jgi:hypothetical protein
MTPPTFWELYLQLHGKHGKKLNNVSKSAASVILKAVLKFNTRGNIMDNYLAIGIAEGFEQAESEDQVIEAWQHLVDTGLAWQLQGWFGRTASDLIDQGIIHRRQLT